MRKLLIAALAMFPALAFAAVANTAHDLQAGPLIAFGSTNGARSTCSFCHAAHHTAGTLGLWVRATPGATGAGWTSTTETSLGTPLPGRGATNHGSQECLSCHDGTIAVNQTLTYAIPGTGESNATATIGGAAVGTDIANLANGATDARLVSGSMAFPILEGTHPISVPYPPANLPASQSGLYGTVQTGSCTAVGAGYCVNNGWQAAAGLATKIVRQTDGTFTVECVSCHDPHYSAGSLFLRPMPTGVTRCVGCHNK